MQFKIVCLYIKVRKDIFKLSRHFYSHHEWFLSRPRTMFGELKMTSAYDEQYLITLSFRAANFRFLQSIAHARLNLLLAFKGE